MANLKINIIDSNIKIKNNISKALQKDIIKIFKSNAPRIESQVKALVYEALFNCPEIISLRQGTLRMDFGIPIDPTNEIVAAIVNSTHVYFRNFDFSQKSVHNVLSVYIQPEDFQNLISNAYANVITERGEVLPWLEWLLVGGDAVQIMGYEVEYGLFDNSRSGGAIMIPTGYFKVDPQFSGTPADNFITRAISPYGDKITQIIKDNI